ncbi:MAG: hypothetical protein ACJ8FY_21520 [Gemmataceae bacterium]
MLFTLWRRLFRQGFKSQRALLVLGPAADLARAGPGGWLIAQEKARLDYLAAKEKHVRAGSNASLEAVLERLLQLQSTNAIVQALLNEHQIERIVAEEESGPEFPIGKSR